MRGASQGGGRQMSRASRRVTGAIIVIAIVAFVVAALTGLINVFPPGS